MHKRWLLWLVLALSSAVFSQNAANNALTQISVGHAHVCGVRGNGSVICWGRNEQSQLAASGLIHTATPRAVPNPANVLFASVSAGQQHTCALSTAGAVWCWGSHWSGQLGIDVEGANFDRPVQVALPNNTRITQISAGAYHTCAVASGGAVYCWGSGGDGQLGNGRLEESNTPVQVPLPTGLRVSRISAGNFHTCALSSAGAAYCWGYNGFGQLGDGSTESSAVPVAVEMPSDTRFTQISLGGSHSCALDFDGIAYCWGGNWNGQLGSETWGSSATPTLVAPSLEARFTTIAAGENHTCGASSGSLVYCWGNGDQGQTGQFRRSLSNTLQIVLFEETSAVSFLEAGSRNTCTVRTSGNTYCFGEGGDGALGNGQFETSAAPVAVVLDPSQVRAVFPDANHQALRGLKEVDAQAAILTWMDVSGDRSQTQQATEDLFAQKLTERGINVTGAAPNYLICLASISSGGGLVFVSYKVEYYSFETTGLHRLLWRGGGIIRVGSSNFSANTIATACFEAFITAWQQQNR